MATATKVRVPSRLLTSNGVFTSQYELMDGIRGYENLSADVFQSDAEQAFLKDIISLFGIDNFEDGKGIVLADLGKGVVYLPLLQNIGGVPAIAWGENIIPLVETEGKLSLGEALVTVSNGSREVQDDSGKKKVVSYCSIECSRVVFGEKLVLNISAKLPKEAGDNDSMVLTDILKDGDFEAALPYLASPGTGGGVYVGLAVFTQLFTLSKIPALPMLRLPIQDIAFTENDWNDQGTIKKIRSLNMKIDPSFMPEEMLIKWKEKGAKNARLFYVHRDSVKGLQVSSDHAAYKAVAEKSGYSQETKTYNPDKFASFKSAMLAGEVLLGVLSFNAKNPSYVPNHTVYVRHTSFKAQADYSAIDYTTLSEYPELPQKDAVTEAPATAVNEAPAAATPTGDADTTPVGQDQGW